MAAGRPRRVDPGALYAFAHQFYWDFRRLAEGTKRWRFDKKKYAELTDGLGHSKLVNEEDKKRHLQIVDEEIRSGRLDPSRRHERLRDIEDSEIVVRWDAYLREAGLESQKEIKVPGELDVIEVLLDPKTTAEQIREVCKDAVMTRTITIGSETRELEVSAWPLLPGSTLPTYLSQYAEQYVVALRDPRFPGCDIALRPSSRLKQFWFLARALAGALYGVSTRTAINLVGSMRPEQVFHESREGKPTRRKRKPKRIMSRKH